MNVTGKYSLKKLCNKLKNWLYYKTTESKLGDYTLTTVEPRFKAIKPKRKYKSAYTIIEGNDNIVIQG